MVDLAGVFTVSIPGNDFEILTPELFTKFLKSLAKIKFPNEKDYTEKLVEELLNLKGQKIAVESQPLTMLIDKTVLRILLMYDLLLRKAFSNFCGQSVRIGGVLTWDEVKKMSIGMEIDGFISFAGSYSIIPQQFSTEQCESLFREVLKRFPLLENQLTLNTSILYPQFQLLIIMLALEKSDCKILEDSNQIQFAKKLVDISNRKPFSETLNEFLRDIGINKVEDDKGVNEQLKYKENMNRMMDKLHANERQNSTVEQKLFSGNVILPSSKAPIDLYATSASNSRQGMMLRMEHLFDEVQSKLLARMNSVDIEETVNFLSKPNNESLDMKVRLPTKPVVIGDAIPIPTDCPTVIEQLLEAALAHHNLGSYEESLKFLEAAKVQYADVELRKRENNTTSENLKGNSSFPTDVEFYILVCKGNVYQSCGDDEQSLLHFMDGWYKSTESYAKNWEIVILSSIGMLAFYNLRYDVALLCFRVVCLYRSSTFGDENADTATALNNEACCYYCLNDRGESRLLFEKCWNTLSRTIGHRAPRTIAVWKNLEKARRSHAPLRSKSDFKSSLEMRSDVDRLLIGGTFTIQALAPPDGGKKKKKKKKKGKKTK